MFGDLTPTQAVLLFRQDNDRAAFRRFICKTGELGGIGQFAVAHAFNRNEFDSLAVAKSDGSGFVEKESVDVAGSLDGFSAHRQHVVLHHAIHAGDADRGQQSADRRRNQADQQRDQNRNSGRSPLPTA